MAFITGGLGALGLLAAHELALSGKDQVVSTSRTGRLASMPPDMQQLVAAMQTQCPHYMVKADCSDGSAVFDTIQALCRPGFLTQQAILLGDIVDTVRQQIDIMPEELVRPTLDVLAQVHKDLLGVAADAKSKVLMSGVVAEDDKVDLRDREDEVAELIRKLQARAGPGVAAVGAVRKTGAQLAEQVAALGVKLKSVTTPTRLDLPQRRLGAAEVVVHAAGVLQDGLLLPNIQRAPDMFSKVFGPKAHAAWTLHQAVAAL